MTLTSRLRELCKKATKGPWYVAGPPWLANDVETYVLSGSPDPHAGEMIFDMPTADMAGVEDKYDETDWSAQNDRNAEYVAAVSPDVVERLLDVVEAARAHIVADTGNSLTGDACDTYPALAEALKVLDGEMER